MLRSRYAAISLAALLPISGVLPDFARADAASPFAGLLGGSGDDRVRAVAVDASGAVFIAGVTASDDLPVRDAYQPFRAGGADAFVAKLASDGKTILFATFLGGTDDDDALALVPDGSGGVWVAGVTLSSDFPVENALNGNPSGGEDGFFAHLSHSGSTLLSSSYLGGSGDDRATAIALDGSGNPWVAGTTGSDDLAVTEFAFRTYISGGKDAFAARISAAGTTLLHATYLGGSTDDEVCGAILGPADSLILAGRTDSADFPVAFPTQPAQAGGFDGFVARISADAASLQFSTFLGGSGDDEARALASGGSGFAITGTSGSSDFPIATGIPPGPVGGTDAFVASFTALDEVQYTALIGGSGDERGLAVVQEGGGAVVIAGTTASEDLPLRAAAIGSPAGAMDGFLVRIAKNGNSITYATYLGGSGEDAVTAMTISSSGSVLIAGSTESSDFVTGAGGTGETAGGADGLVARVPTAPLPPAGFAATTPTHKVVNLSWTDVSGGRASFDVERRVGAGMFEPLLSLPAGATSTNDTAIAPASLYAYRVRAVVEGTPSPFGAELGVVTPSIPIPAMPGVPTVVAESPREIRVSWQDLSEDEISFEVFRSVDGGPSSVLRSVSAGTTEIVDAVSPDRTWSYSVRSVGVSGPSPLTAAASASTSATLVVDPVQGRRTDGTKVGRDSVSLVARVSGAEGEPMPDPRSGGLQIGVGAGDAPAIVSIPAGTAGWKDRRGVLTWKSSKDFPGKVTVVVDRIHGTLKLKATGVELTACDAAAVRVWVRCAPEAGSTVESWLERKPGRLTIAD